MIRFLLVMLTVGLSVWAQAEPKLEDSHGQKYLIMPKVLMIEEDSSQFHRVDKNYQATVLLVGVGPSIATTYGVQLGKYLDLNNVLIFEATTGTNNWNSTSSTGTYGRVRDLSATSLGLHYKHFSGNSFYFRVGADYRTLKYKSTFTNLDQSRDITSFDGDSVAMNLQIGNQWQWESFTLGCDWVGYSLPVTSTIKNMQVVSSSDYEKKWAKEDADMYITKGNLNLLRFYMGASF